MQDELSELMQRADLPLARQLSSSGSGAAGGSGGAGSSREGMRNRIATALRLQLAPPSKGSIRNYFQRAAPPPPAQQQQPAAAAAAAGSAGVLVTNVCAAPLRSQLRAAVLAACGACIQLEPEFVELLQKVELLFYLGAENETPLLRCHLYSTNDQFTKAGSGQTQEEKLRRKMMRFLFAENAKLGEPNTIFLLERIGKK